MSNTTGATIGTGTDYTFEAPEFTHSFKWGLCCSICIFLCSVSYCLSSFSLSLYFLHLFDLQFLIAILVPSNFSLYGDWRITHSYRKTLFMLGADIFVRYRSGNRLFTVIYYRCVALIFVY
jgi:hypothetical protein